MDVLEKYKTLRDQIRPLELDDALRVIWAYCQFLQTGKDLPADLTVPKEFLTKDFHREWISEWELELIAKEVLINAGFDTQRKLYLKEWGVLATIVNSLKRFENEIYGAFGSPSNVLVELIRISHRQFIWQGNPPNSASTIRYFKIFNTETIGEVCKERIGLTVREIYLCGLSFLGAYMSDPMVSSPVRSTIKNAPADKFKAFLSFAAKPLSELRSILSNEQQYNESFAYGRQIAKC